MQADRFTVKSQEALAAAQRLAGARRNPQVTPQHLLVALLEQEGGIVVPVLRRANADPEGVRRRANEALDALPTVTGDAERGPALGQDLIAPAPARRRGGARDRRRVRLDRAPAARARRRPAASTPAPRATSSPRPSQQVRGPHRVTDQNPEDKYQALEKYGRDLTEPAEQRQARPGHRPRRRDPPRDPGALAPHEEQPGADRRARRRQDRDRRGPRAAHRRRATCPSRCATGA